MTGVYKTQDCPAEGHRWVVGYEGRYSATQCGKLYGWCIRSGAIRGRVNGWVTKSGRNRVELWSSPQRRKKFDMARCILSAHTGRHVCLEPLLALHNDGNPLNNHISNLRWGSHLDNRDDAIKHGTVIAKTTLCQRQEVVRKFKTGRYTQKRLAIKYGVSPRMIRKILKAANIPSPYQRRKESL